MGGILKLFSGKNGIGCLGDLPGQIVPKIRVGGTGGGK